MLLCEPKLIVYTIELDTLIYMPSYEIEIKSLLGTKDKVEELKEKLEKHRLPFSFVSENKQLNHYFINGSIEQLAEMLLPYLSEDTHEQFIKIIKEGNNHSIRTRQINDKVIIVIKASLDEMTSSNGISRIEFEAPVNLILNALDQVLLDAQYEYQAKWSREREEYDLGDVRVCVDKNAGYGYVAEFEKVISDEAESDDAVREIRMLMGELEVEELPQDRLERMFAHYNKHWQDYYGTEKMFVID